MYARRLAFCCCAKWRAVYWLYLSSGAQRGSGFQLAGICGAFAFVLCICHLALNEVLIFSWPVYVGHLYLFFVFVIWRSRGFWVSAGWYIWGICICSLYLSSGAQGGSGFQLAGRCGAFVFVLCICYLALNGVLGFSWPVYVGHLYLFFVFVIWRSAGFSESGFQLADICEAFVFVLRLCNLALNKGLGFSWPVYVGHLYLFFVFVIWRSTGFWLSAGQHVVGICICSLYLSSGAQWGPGFQLAGICGAFVLVSCSRHLALNGVLAFSWPVYVGHLYCICSFYLSSGAAGI
jgi:hypothetical protein